MFHKIFSGVIDSSRIIEGQADAIYGDVTTGFKNKISGALKPQNSDEISKIIAVCREHHIKIYPISSGLNWGYSDSMPAGHDNVVLDLSLMQGIRDYNPDSGVVIVEPGVTQKQLYEFLKSHGSKHIVSVTGSSPDASIIGNYLERGLGLLPVMDHALSVLSLTAILGDGSTYISPLQALGGHKSAQSFRWGIGPYTDGLFFQSSFGVVTDMMIKLSPTPEAIEVCLIEVSDREMLSHAMESLKILRGSWGLESLQIKILNGYYSLSSTGVKYDDISKINSIEDACKKYDVPPYTVMITFSGNKILVKALERYLKRAFKFCKRTRILNDRLVHFSSILKFLLPNNLKAKVSVLQGLWDLLQGMPGNMMIGRIPYYRMSHDAQFEKINPAKDGCGIIWVALALPFDDGSLSDFETLGAYAQAEYGFDPVINFTNYSQSGMVGLFAIVFDKNSESDKARDCYMDLLARAQKQGYLPYRMPLFASEEFFKDTANGSFNQKLSELLDPDHIFARQC